LGCQMSKYLIPTLPFLESMQGVVPVRVEITGTSVDASTGMEVDKFVYSILEVGTAEELLKIMDDAGEFHPSDLEGSPEVWVSESTMETGVITTLTLVISNASDELLNEVVNKSGVLMNTSVEAAPSLGEISSELDAGIGSLVDDVLEPSEIDSTVTDNFVDELTF